MERIGDTDRARTPVGHDGIDEVSPIGADMGDLGATLGSEEIEELTHGRTGASRRSPHQPTGVVVDHDHQKLEPALVADLIDPDPPQPGQTVMLGLDVSPDPGDDRPHGAPRDPHQLGHRGLR